MSRKNTNPQCPKAKSVELVRLNTPFFNPNIAPLQEQAITRIKESLSNRTTDQIHNSLEILNCLPEKTMESLVVLTDILGSCVHEGLKTRAKQIIEKHYLPLANNFIRENFNNKDADPKKLIASIIALESRMDDLMIILIRQIAETHTDPDVKLIAEKSIKKLNGSTI